MAKALIDAERAWNNMPSITRCIVTTRVWNGLRSDADRTWTDIPDERRLGYAKAIKPRDIT